MNVLETMKQALGALEFHQDYIAFKRSGEAITNLRAAIAEMEAEVCSSCSSEFNKCRITGTKHEPDEMIDIVERLRFHVPRDIGTDDLRKEAADEITRLRQICRDAYEVWAGSEGIPEPVYASEAYLYQLLTNMRDEVKKGL